MNINVTRPLMQKPQNVILCIYRYGRTFTQITEHAMGDEQKEKKIKKEKNRERESERHLQTALQIINEIGIFS